MLLQKYISSTRTAFYISKNWIKTDYCWWSHWLAVPSWRGGMLCIEGDKPGGAPPCITDLQCKCDLLPYWL